MINVQSEEHSNDRLNLLICRSRKFHTDFQQAKTAEWQNGSLDYLKVRQKEFHGALKLIKRITDNKLDNPLEIVAAAEVEIEQLVKEMMDSDLKLASE